MIWEIITETMRDILHVSAAVVRTTKMTEEDKPLRCPICDIHLPTVSGFVYTHIWNQHNRKEILHALMKMIAERQEPSIPVSKIEEKIAELENNVKGYKGFQHEYTYGQIVILKSLLGDKQE
jgi:hypothetical protein